MMQCGSLMRAISGVNIITRIPVDVFGRVSPRAYTYTPYHIPHAVSFRDSPVRMPVRCMRQLLERASGNQCSRELLENPKRKSAESCIPRPELEPRLARNDIAPSSRFPPQRGEERYGRGTSTFASNPFSPIGLLNWGGIYPMDIWVRYSTYFTI